MIACRTSSLLSFQSSPLVAQARSSYPPTRKSPTLFVLTTSTPLPAPTYLTPSMSVSATEAKTPEVSSQHFRILSLPPDFYYIPNFITAEEEASILQKVGPRIGSMLLSLMGVSRWLTGVGGAFEFAPHFPASPVLQTLDKSKFQIPKIRCSIMLKVPCHPIPFSADLLYFLYLFFLNFTVCLYSIPSRTRATGLVLEIVPSSLSRDGLIRSRSTRG